MGKMTTRNDLARAAGQLREAAQRRDRLIAQAYREGASLRGIAEIANLTHEGVRQILVGMGVYGVHRDAS